MNIADLWHHGRQVVHRSLQARTVALAMMAAFLVAAVLCSVSLYAVRSSVLAHATDESRKDFSSLTAQAQKHLNAADVTEVGQYQQLVGNIASEMQSSGGANLIGVYLMENGNGSMTHSIVPVSTEPEYYGLITDDLREAVQADTEGHIQYQPVRIDSGTVKGIPGAILGATMVSSLSDSLAVFALYSYQAQQESLAHIQLNLMLICVLLSMFIGLLVFVIMHSVVSPVRHVASAAEIMASGKLDTRVEVDRADEIGVLQKSFNEMADAVNQKIDELEQAGDMQRRFVSDVSHELRTPVTTMKMASDMLMKCKDAFEPPAKRTVELLDGQIARFQSMLADLLEISRFDAGYASVDLTEIDIRDAVENSVEQITAIAQAKSVPLNVDLPHIEVLAYVDVRRVTRIMRNLLANAVDFAGDGPVEVKVAANRKTVVLSVRDYGIGMGEDEMQHVFDRFWRGDPSRVRTTGGTGLGLSIVMADVKLHHGDIALRSQKGQGTWFLVEIPRDPRSGVVDWSEAPVSFVTGDDGFHIRGGFGIADNGFVDYLTNEPMALVKGNLR